MQAEAPRLREALRNTPHVRVQDASAEVSDDLEGMSRVDPVSGVGEVVVSEKRLATAIDRKLSKTPARAAGSGQKAGASGSQLLTGVGVTVDPTFDVVIEASDGGVALMSTNTSTRMCTAAFPAKYGSNSGLLTAEHCPDALTVGAGNNLYNASVFMPRTKGDTQWHRSKIAVSGNFQYDWGKYRPVWAHPTLKVGTKVCRFGKTTGTGTGCTTVKYVQACIKCDRESFSRCELAMTETHTGSKGGDSGGPWYYGNNGYGVHSGSGPRDGVQRNWFQSSAKAIAAMGLTPIYGAR